MEMKTRGAKLPNFALQMKEAHWNKKDVETIYSNSCVTKKQQDSDDETNESSCNSRDAKNISDVSDSEEPELKKLRFNTDDPLPSDNKMFEKDTGNVVKGKMKYGRFFYSNPNRTLKVKCKLIYVIGMIARPCLSSRRSSVRILRTYLQLCGV